MRAATLALTLLLLPVGANAQIGNAAFMTPDTNLDEQGMPAPDQANTTDKLFAQLAAEGGLAEVELGRLATERAEASAVQDFARRMVDDHSSANTELASIAEGKGFPLPDALNPAHAALRAELEELDGMAFDIAYMRAQVVDHQKTMQLLIWEIGSGQNAALQQFASQTLPAVLAHLTQARGIVTDLSLAQGSETPAPRR